MDAAALGAFAAFALAAPFSAAVLRRGRRPSDVLWGAGLALYAVAALLEGVALVRGWSPLAYRAYFVAAGLLVGLLGLGTVALSGRRALGAGAVVVAALAATLAVGAAVADLAPTPPDAGADGIPFPHPARVAFLLLNVLGGLALVGGAFASWLRSRRPGVLLIGIGALLPFLGGASSTLGAPAARVALQLAGLGLMFGGYLLGRPTTTRGTDHEDTKTRKLKSSG